MHSTCSTSNARRRRPDSASSGFTLLEISVVLVIIALITGMAVSSGISIVSSARFAATQKKMAAIDAALLQFRTYNNRLPCPGDLTLAPSSANYGIEAGAGTGTAIATGTGVCTDTGMLPQATFTATNSTNTYGGVEGSLPALTLGLPADMMYDGWGNLFRYAVDVTTTANGVFATLGTSCVAGTIKVKDAAGNSRSTASIYALISHGANGHGAYTKNGVTMNAASTNANELVNCHCNSSGATTTSSGAQTSNPATYIQAGSSLDSTTLTNAFDDIVTYKERWQMQAAWDKAGACPPSVYVVDAHNGRIQVFDLKGNYIKTLLNGALGFAGEVGYIVFDKSGNFWVGDGTTDQVEQFDLSGNLLNTIYTNYANCGVINGVAVDSANNVWFACHYRNTAYKYSSSGTLLAQIGCSTPGFCAPGSANGQLNDPYGIAVDANDNLYVAEVGNKRVQKFDSNGNYLGKFSTAQGTEATGIKFDTSGNIWVSEFYYAEKYNSSTFALMQTVGAGTSGSGQPLQFYGGFDMALDSTGSIWYSDCYEDHIQKIAADGVTFQLQLGCANGTCSAGSGNTQLDCPAGIYIH